MDSKAKIVRAYKASDMYSNLQMLMSTTSPEKRQDNVEPKTKLDGKPCKKITFVRRGSIISDGSNSDSGSSDRRSGEMRRSSNSVVSASMIDVVLQDDLSSTVSDGDNYEAHIAVDMDLRSQKCRLKLSTFKRRLSSTELSLETGNYIVLEFSPKTEEDCSLQISKLIDKTSMLYNNGLSSLTVVFGYETAVSTLFPLVLHCTAKNISLRLFYMKDEIFLI
ncbi:hypothetical protein HDV06_000813 [Boothiomyces sp. JEL0866]|nr:hypothetical protein HDV06_000813 [Boothiomyces sp. JEL0866]